VSFIKDQLGYILKKSKENKKKPHNFSFFKKEFQKLQITEKKGKNLKTPKPNKQSKLQIKGQRN
jgi:hypothetical protein